MGYEIGPVDSHRIPGTILPKFVDSRRIPKIGGFTLKTLTSELGEKK